MQRLLMLYYVRSGYLRPLAYSITSTARSVPYSPFRARRSTRSSIRIEPRYGVKALVVCPLGRRGANNSRPEAVKVSMDPVMKDLLSAAIANSRACRNWLSKPTPNLERASVSIAHVIRDMDAMAGMVE